jgi:putative membrane protein
MLWGYGFNWIGMCLMVFGMVLWIGLLAILAWALTRWLNNKTLSAIPRVTDTHPHSPSAMEILYQRYARGEITRETFEQMRSRLEAIDSSQDEFFTNQRVTS